MNLINDNEIFVHGDIKCSDGLTHEDASELIQEIQELMIFHKIVKIDLCIDPYKFPRELLDIGKP
jgi:hypothetical protein